MQGLAHLLSDPFLVGVAILVVGGAVAILQAGPAAFERRVRWLRGLWIAGFLALSMWGMRQEQALQAAALEASAEAPVAVTSRGSTRYVSEAQAFRRDAVLWVILAAGLGFALVENRLRRDRDPGPG